jgi:multidrug efflux pump subunit AcrA (membrane-fusion protein)
VKDVPPLTHGVTAPSTPTRRWRPRRRLVAGLSLLVAAVAAAIAVTNPFSGGGGSGGGAFDKATTTSLATVTRRSLTAQTQVDGTLGYKGSSTIVLPTGTSPSDLRQLEQTVASDQATLAAAQATLSTDSRALEAAQATLAADRLKLASICAGTNAAGGGSDGSGGSGSGGDGSGGDGSGGNSTPCETAAQAVTSDEEAVSTAQGKVTTDSGSVATAEAALAGAEKSLEPAASSAVFYETGSTYTTLPSPGDVIRRGRTLFAISGQPVLLLYGGVTAWRAFRAGMSPGRDVAALNANLRALGYGKGLSGDSFTASTAEAIRALQAARGLAPTGELPLGAVVFKSGPVRVKTVTPTRGSTVQSGPVLSVSSTRHQVTIALDAAQQAEVRVGDPVTITLPSNQTTPGRVSSVGKVASSGGEDGSATVEVTVKLTDEAAAGQLDQAPVQAAIITDRVKNALTVPVTALLALAGGGYAVEVVAPTGVHRLVAVELGLFDDAGGLVQVSGSGLRAGQRVVVPGS